jgi:hypothetical protein
MNSNDYTQCKRCKGWFDEDGIVECVTVEGQYLAHLCEQCVHGWIQYDAFLEANK